MGKMLPGGWLGDYYPCFEGNKLPIEIITINPNLSKLHNFSYVTFSPLVPCNPGRAIYSKTLMFSYLLCNNTSTVKTGGKRIIL